MELYNFPGASIEEQDLIRDKKDMINPMSKKERRYNANKSAKKYEEPDVRTLSDDGNIKVKIKDKTTWKDEDEESGRFESETEKHEDSVPESEQA